MNQDRLIALLAKIRQDCKGLPVANTLAINEVTDVKSFITLDPGFNIMKTPFSAADTAAK